jgi:prepilin-type N-terminal cleavage/methylation domain-containing protein
MRKQRGFTLIEIAIVLVIIGLLLGGVLKGQELITSARVRNLISQQDGIKAAYFGFLDRFRALPGDYTQASINIANVAATSNGNGNGQITVSGVSGATIDEHVAVWEHLSKAGFINGSYTYAAGAEDCHLRGDQSLRSLYPGDIRYSVRRRHGVDTSQRENRQPGSVRHHGRDRSQDRRRQSAGRQLPVLHLRRRWNRRHRADGRRRRPVLHRWHAPALVSRNSRHQLRRSELALTGLERPGRISQILQVNARFCGRFVLARLVRSYGAQTARFHA